MLAVADIELICFLSPSPGGGGADAPVGPGGFCQMGKERPMPKSLLCRQPYGYGRQGRKVRL